MKRYDSDKTAFRDEVIARIRNAVTDGSPLKRALNTLQISQGKIFSFLPDGFTLDDPAMLDMTFHPDVRAWTKTPADLAALQEKVVGFIHEYLTAEEDHI